MTLTTNKKTTLLILFAFAFSIVVRLIWVEQFSSEEQFKFNGEFMINTNDGYYYAEGARDILAGVTKNTNDLSPFENATSVFTALIVKILPFSFETVIFYMPAFFASLLVIPIILIAREFDRLEVGFIAALVASVAWSYYNRTMVGYFDTDFLNIVFPTVLLWSLIWALKTNEDKYLLIAALDSIAYRWWYPQSYSLEFAFIALIAIYVVYQYIKKQDFQTNLLLISFMLFAMVNLDGFVRLSVVVAFYILLKTKRDLVFRYLYYIFAVALILFFVTGGFDPIWGKLKGYVFRDALDSGAEGLGLHFFTVMQTVREAGKIPFEMFANRISGHTLTLLASMLGYVWFVYRHPVMLLALPMVGLGFLAYGIPGLFDGGGLRFTIYAVPVMALGLGFIIYEISKWLSTKFINDKVAQISKYVFMTLFTLGALYPNIAHVIGYKVPTVFTQDEVKLLDKLHEIADREDYVVAWWDYGYPIRYYSDVKTLIDGGKHSGSVNFPVSFILNSPQDPAAKMARLDVEYTEKRFSVNEANKGLDVNHTNYVEFASSNIEQMTLDYKYNNTNDFLNSLNEEIELPAKTRDVYLYLPNRMVGIVPTITLFSNLDLMSGKKRAQPFFYISGTVQETQESVELGNGVRIIKKMGQVQIGNDILTMNSFIVTEYDANGVLRKNVQVIDKDSPVSVIFMKNYNQFLVLDKNMLNSTYIQLFVLENYDETLYEPVILNPMAKIFKLKI
ncbi:MAG: peptide transporter [Sulfurimonas sp.]|uniref:STT3 domain-containing protein n=1 Tax=Sulfurimonas sp. TaxID=2022749 RepID=UPI0025EAB23F|nr:STT3 domain-containing protein [Sulfurimonas sp.]MCK9491171.1 peptide transporter [Sulfurimonas sp.]